MELVLGGLTLKKIRRL